MSMLSELLLRHFLLQARPSLCCAVGYMGIDIYTEPGALLPGFQAPYLHFTIWHAYSAAWLTCRRCVHFFLHHDMEIQESTTTSNF